MPQQNSKEVLDIMHEHIHQRIARIIEIGSQDRLEHAMQKEADSLAERLETLDTLLPRLSEPQRKAIMYVFTSEVDMLVCHFLIEAAQVIDRPQLVRDAAQGDDAAFRRSVRRLQALTCI
jgi:phosphotransacetylase